ncbi:uncharacterized protein LOC130683639, partial [Manis pentadactyla]|uniref:uncharacterized protein LOC130683639 n=1 Tax=Manis pentadactyla TaxID=143292 RepID=UPI00255D158A
MSSPSHSRTPSPTQSPIQSPTQSQSDEIQQPPSSSGGSAPSPSPSQGPSSPAPSQHPTPNASQPSSPRASSLTPSPHIQHVPRRSAQATPPTSKSGLKFVSRNASQTPPVPLTKSPSYIGPTRGIPSYIAPYVPRILKEPPFFQPPTSPLPQSQCFPRTSPCPAHQRPVPPDSLYFPLLPPPPHHPRVTCSYPTPPALFTPPSSLTYTPPTEVLVSGKPHVVPTLLPATFYTPFSRHYAQPRPCRPAQHRR